jgi:hypothetical protein
MWWLFVLLALVGCGRGSKDLADVTVELTVAPDPPQIGPATVTVSLRGADQEPLTGARLQLEGNMSHAGMVPVFAQAVEIAPGQYQADLEFTMGGDWFILVQADLADGRSMEHKVDLPGVDVYCSETPLP